jgi:hypothetical protein
MQNTILACVVFWCSGILGWRPEKRGFGGGVVCTWHAARAGLGFLGKNEG